MRRISYQVLLGCMLAACAEQGEPVSGYDVPSDDEQATTLEQQRAPTLPGFPGFPGIRRDGGAIRPRLPRPPLRPDGGRPPAVGARDGGAGTAVKPPDAGAGVAPTTDPACAGLTYADFGQTFLETYCLACHQGDFAARHINLSTLAGVQSWKGAIGLHAVETRTSIRMPPDDPGLPQPSDEERERLGRWLACGPN